MQKKSTHLNFTTYNIKEYITVTSLVSPQPGDNAIYLFFLLFNIGSCNRNAYEVFKGKYCEAFEILLPSNCSVWLKETYKKK